MEERMDGKPRSVGPIGLLATLALLSCGGGDGGTTDPATTGTLRVTVTADGTGRAGVTVRRFASGASTATESQTTGGNGVATFSTVSPGSHDVEIDVPDGFALDQGESDRKAVSVTAGATTNTSFALSSDDAGEVVEILLSGTSFSDADVTITPGTTVRWINQDGMDHTVTPDGHGEWSSAALNNTGQSFSHTFTAEGTLEYFCQPHFASGMTGVIRVQQ
jgi:plastocyanin